MEKLLIWILTNSLMKGVKLENHQAYIGGVSLSSGFS